MEKVKKVLEMQRSSFDQVFDDILKLFTITEKDKIGIFSKINLLEQKIDVLMDLHKQVVDFLLDDDALKLEILTADEYSAKYFKVKLMADNLSNKNFITDNISQCSSDHKRKLKLPKIEFKKFGGEIKDWLPFWSQFQRVDNDDHIASEDKFQYLIQATIPNSRARQLVDSYPPSAENYPKVIESLMKRFGRKDLLVEFYVRELLMLVLNNISNNNNLTFLYDKMESQLRALETLEVTSETCVAMLYPLIESCLPEDLIRVWQRSNLYTAESTLKDRLDKLMSFLRKEVENEERIILATSGFDIQNKSKKKNDAPKQILPTASGLMNNRFQKKCNFCSGIHSSELCTEAKKWTLFDRKKKLIEKACCYQCLKYGHISRKCRVNVTCTICGGKHHDIMCSKHEDSESKPSEMVSTNVENNLSNSCFSEVFLQTLIVNLNGSEKSRTARVIVDTGSQKSYITKTVAEEMGYDCLRQEEIIHALFGGSKTTAVKHKCYRIRLSSLKNDYACNFEALDHSIICSNVACVRKGPWIDELQSVGIEITDSRDGPIDVLIGADIAGKLFTGNRYELECGLVALETRLGWTLMGKLDSRYENTKSSMVMSMFSKNESISDLWNLDILGISDPAEKRTQKETEEYIMSQFLNTITRNDDGRYEVCMSWIEDHPPLPSNYEIARKRLHSLLKKLKADGYYDQYNQILREWLNEGIIEEVPQLDLLKEGHYLPHRHVVKENSATTKIRPVFDASAREKSQPSLNQCLEKGINLIELIPSLLIRFRISKFGVISDIRKAFLQINLNVKERDYLRFLWLNNAGMLTYRHTRVVFGITCSPFLLAAVIEYHLKHCLENSLSEETRSIINQLLKSFYVDNCVTSLDSREELRDFIQVSTRLFADAKFDLRGWEHTVFDDSPINTNISSVLGLCWNETTDTLQLNSEWFREINTEIITKRVILSTVHRLFDPIGFSCPVSVCPKILLQKTWELKTGWDTKVQEDIKRSFLNWVEEIPTLLSLKIPRWLFVSIEGKKHYSLHVFCDASQQAYATAIFLRSETCEGVNVQLVQAKSRVSPVKRMTIPRLELLAATIGARLSKTVVDTINPSMLVYWWSDSTTVLSWIKDDEKWKPFVWNRVEEIRSLTNKIAWYHVPGNLNPADLPSRGCSPKQLIDSKWWEGPQWLRKSPKFWPNQNYTKCGEAIESEKEISIVSTNLSTTINFSWYHERISKYGKIIRVLGWIRRFIANCRNTKDKRIVNEELSLTEVDLAEKCILKLVQIEAFNGLDDTQLKSFCCFIDDDGIIRIRSKISERNDLPDFRFPIILPSKHPLVSKLVFEKHVKSLHVGVQTLLGLLRERFWIIRGRKTVKSIISKCITCRRFNAKHVEVPPVSLPENRVRQAHIFEVIGVDLAGPLYIRTGEKVWICLYTCAIYRAVHLELLSSLSTDVFLQSFRRFVARRGRPSTVYSDNGTNFLGAANAFSQLDWKIITTYSTAEKIAWKFNPPTAAWWGGWWERLIGVIKDILRKVLGEASLTYEELSTILCDCESIMNSRPLTYTHEDSGDLVPLTPAMFLKEIPECGVPDLDAVESSDMRRHLRYRMKLKDNLRRRFRSEYLGQMKLSSKNNVQRVINVGDIVLIGSDNSKRLDWPLAYVEELLPGHDNKIRLVKLKTAKGTILRPLQRVYPLELNCTNDLDLSSLTEGLPEEISHGEEAKNEKEDNHEEDSGRSEPLPITTRYGRKVKPIHRLGM